MNAILAGLMAAVPLSTLGLFYMLRRGDRFVVRILTSGEQVEAPDISKKQLRLLMMSAFTLAPFVLGVAAGLVYLALPQVNFPLLALGLAFILSLAAVVGNAPLVREKIIVNFLVALDLGLLLPLLTSG